MKELENMYQNAPLSQSISGFQGLFDVLVSMDIQPVGRGDAFICSTNITECLLCAGHCIGAGDSKIRKNRHERGIYKTYSLAWEMAVM